MSHSETLEQALNEKLKTIESEKWLAENKNAMTSYNQFIDDNGCFSDEYRDF